MDTVCKHSCTPDISTLAQLHAFEGASTTVHHTNTRAAGRLCNAPFRRHSQALTAYTQPWQREGMNDGLPWLSTSGLKLRARMEPYFSKSRTARLPPTHGRTRHMHCPGMSSMQAVPGSSCCKQRAWWNGWLWEQPESLTKTVVLALAAQKARGLNASPSNLPQTHRRRAQRRQRPTSAR